jgi:hypothetical protein
MAYCATPRHALGFVAVSWSRTPLRPPPPPVRRRRRSAPTRPARTGVPARYGHRLTPPSAGGLRGRRRRDNSRLRRLASTAKTGLDRDGHAVTLVGAAYRWLTFCLSPRTDNHDAHPPDRWPHRLTWRCEPDGEGTATADPWRCPSRFTRSSRRGVAAPPS